MTLAPDIQGGVLGTGHDRLAASLLMRRRARLSVTLTRVPCPRAPAQMTSGAGSRRAPGRAETVEAAPDLTSGRAGDYVGPTIPREAPDAEHEGCLRAQASARDRK